MLKRLSLAFAAVIVASSLAFAHDDHDHTGHDHAHDEASHDHSAKHGGVLVHSGHHHLELVLQDGTLRLYVTSEEGKPESIEGAKASATVLSGGKTAAVTLVPSGDNILEGKGDFTAAKGATVVVNLTLAEHETEQARFRFE